MKALFLVGLFSLLLTDLAAASCANPYRPRVEQHEMGIQMNYFAETAQICIVAGFKVENDCEQCKTGHLHQCTDNRWKPLLTHACNDTRERDAAKVPPPSILRPNTDESKNTEPSADDDGQEQHTRREDNESRLNSHSSKREAAYQRCKSVPTEAFVTCVDAELRK